METAGLQCYPVIRIFRCKEKIMKARIYKPSKSAMQSGKGKGKAWVLEYELTSARVPEPLMGWVSARDTLNQVKIPFDTAEQAADFAHQNGLEYIILPPQERIVSPRTYSDNFKYRASKPVASGKKTKKA